MTSSHPFIAVKAQEYPPTRHLLPIYPPPGPLDYPSLPCTTRSLPAECPFTLSTHIIPAAHLRRGPRIPIPDIPSDPLEKNQGLAKLSKRLYKNSWDSAILNDQHENILWNVLNRYARKNLTNSNSTGITLFFVHANGFPKETWEPILDRIFASPVANRIDEVWAWEGVQNGDAGIINSKALAGFFDWTDNTRDMLNFLLHFLPKTPLDTVLPLHLARVAPTKTQQRLKNGFQHRKVIAIAHSYGATSLALGITDFPTLLSSFILVDPTIITHAYPEATMNDVSNYRVKAVNNALLRRDTWESREEAYTEFFTSRFYKAWDRDMLKAYVEHGLYETTIETPSGERKYVLKLKMTPLQEALVFIGGQVPHEAFARFSQLDEKVRLHWIVSGAKGAPEFGPPGAQRERVWVRPGNSSNTRITRAGHLVPQECAPEFAQEIITFLERHYSGAHLIRASL